MQTADPMTAASKTTPKDFFLYLFGAITMYAAASTAITLFWQLINLVLPESRAYADFGVAETLRWAIAVLAVSFPAYAAAMWHATNEVVRTPAKDGMWVRRWYIGANIFLGSVIAAGDLVAVLYGFLQGELTLRFALKAFVVLVIAGSVLAYYARQWRAIPAKGVRRAALAIASVVLGAGIVAGIALTGSPMKARAMRNDAARVDDLVNLQFQVASYWQLKQRLPETAADLVDPGNPVPLPTDPETGAAYRYEKRGENEYALCAVFKTELSAGDARYRYGVTAVDDAPSETWAHGAGETCFARKIDPERYPKQVQ